MISVCLTILALVGGFDRHPAVENHDSRRSSLVQAAPARMISGAQAFGPTRRAKPLPFRTPWSVSSFEEFDTEEPDESWMLEHDAAGSIGQSGLSWSWPRSSPESPTRLVQTLSGRISLCLRC